MPLDGVTTLEFGEMVAAPYATSVLADLGARVVKFEAMAGDSIRNLLPFPETAGAKVMQGQESVQVDLHTPEGREVVHRAVGKADVVLQPMRAGAAARLGVDQEALCGVNRLHQRVGVTERKDRTARHRRTRRVSPRPLVSPSRTCPVRRCPPRTSTRRCG